MDKDQIAGLIDKAIRLLRDLDNADADEAVRLLKRARALMNGE